MLWNIFSAYVRYYNISPTLIIEFYVLQGIPAHLEEEAAPPHPAAPPASAPAPVAPQPAVAAPPPVAAPTGQPQNLFQVCVPSPAIRPNRSYISVSLLNSSSNSNNTTLNLMRIVDRPAPVLTLLLSKMTPECNNSVRSWLRIPR